MVVATAISDEISHGSNSSHQEVKVERAGGVICNKEKLH
jgi:hypothetical protein